MPLEFGVCTNFLETPDTDPVGMCLIPAIAEAGFQYVELPLCHVAALSDREFERLADVIHSSGLRSPAACNLFPDQMPLLGGQANPGEISAYLEHALCRASRLGIRKVVFASVSAWTASGSCQDRRAEIVELVRGTVAPAFQKYQIRLLLEGLRRQVCNAVNTLPEAAEICRQAAHPYVGVMADLYHMICNGESPDELAVYGNEIEHVHIAERDRLLPFAGVSAELAALTKQLADGAYEGHISFEARALFTVPAMRAARENICRILTSGIRN